MDAKKHTKNWLKRPRITSLNEVNDRLPRKVGVVTVNHFNQNFLGLSMVDEDYDQLDAMDKGNVEMHPVTFPTVTFCVVKCNL